MGLTAPSEAYRADPSLKGKLRRRLARLRHRRSLARSPRQGLVTFSFDDAPASACRTGAEILDANGAKGVWYLNSGLFAKEGPMGTYGDGDDASRLARAGHEIGCHTAHHIDCGQAEPAAIAADVEANRQALAGLGVTPRHFAYPYGDVSARAKAWLGQRFDSCRALHPGLVTRGSDLNQLPAIGIEGPDGPRRALSWMHRAADQSAWLILYTHDVRPDASPWGCTPDALSTLVAEARRLGLRPVTLSQGLEACRG